MLTRAGHRVVVVQNLEQVGQALAAAKADIVLTNLSEVGVISSQASASRIAPLILPVLKGATRAQTAACKLKYPCNLTQVRPLIDRQVVASQSLAYSQAPHRMPGGRPLCPRS